MLPQITHLSYNAVKTMTERQFKSLPIVVQLIDIGPIMKVENQESIIQCTINDGFAFVDIGITALHQDILQNRGKLRPIIKIMDYNDEESLIIVTNYQILQLQVSDVIGNPIPFELFQQQSYQNKNGNNQISTSKSGNKIILNPKKSENQTTRIISSKQVQQIQKKQEIIIPKKQFKDQYTKQVEQQEEKIDDLYPGIRVFKIKGRVIKKSNKVPFKNGRGYFFNIEIMDQYKSTIIGSFFNQIADKFENEIELGKIYYFEVGSVRANRNYQNNQSGNYCQIIFEEYSKIVLAEEDENISRHQYECKNISEIEEMPKDEICDFIGIVQDVQPLMQIITKKNEQREKKTITLFDQTSKEIQLTFWGQAAESNNLEIGQFVAFHGVRVTEFQNQKGLTALGQTTYETDLNELEKNQKFEKLQEFNNKCQLNSENRIQKSRKFKTKTSLITQILKEFEDKSEKEFHKFYEIRAYLGYINPKQNLFYESCRGCHKKIAMMEDLKYFCKSCDKVFDEPLRRYIFSAKFIDSSASIYCSINDAQGNIFLKITADQFNQLSDLEKNHCLKRVMNYEYRLLVLGKIEEYNGIIRPRYSVVQIQADDFKKESAEMVQKLEELLKGQ